MKWLALLAISFLLVAGCGGEETDSGISIPVEPAATTEPRSVAQTGADCIYNRVSDGLAVGTALEVCGQESVNYYGSASEDFFEAQRGMLLMSQCIVQKGLRGCYIGP